MKNSILIILLITCGIVFGQNKIYERKQTTENGVTKGWIITKELDENGNVIRYDSSYFEKDAAKANPEKDFDQNVPPFDLDTNSMWFRYDFDTLGIDNNFRFFNFPDGQLNQFGFGFNDSLYQHFFDPDEFETDVHERMRKHQEMMEQFFKEFKFPENYTLPDSSLQSPTEEKSGLHGKGKRL